MSHASQFQLLRQTRFGPFFWALFLGTANDSLLKYAVVVWLTYQANLPWLPPALVGSLAGGLVMLPSVLLSATSGQVSDRWPLHLVIRWGKTFELVMMVLAAWALWARTPWLMLACVVLSGIHITLFSTAKYAYLPRHLQSTELVGGNGMMEMGMFTSILLGTLLGGLLGAPQDIWPDLPDAVARGLAPALLLALAVVGWWVACAIPATPASDPGLRVNLNPVTETWRNLRRAQQHGPVMATVLGISWMWFYAALLLTLFPAITHEALHAQAAVVSVLLVVISLGIGLGSISCEWLLNRLGQRQASGRASAMVLVPLGALGMAVFGADLARNLMALEAAKTAPAGGWPLLAFLQQGAHQHVMVDLWLLAMSVGWFSVPLYAEMQARAEPSHRARLIGANNIINALFMLACAAWAGVLGAMGLGMGGIIMATVFLHVAVVVLALVIYPPWRRECLPWWFT